MKILDVRMFQQKNKWAVRFVATTRDKDGRNFIETYERSFDQERDATAEYDKLSASIAKNTTTA